MDFGKGKDCLAARVIPSGILGEQRTDPNKCDRVVGYGEQES